MYCNNCGMKLEEDAIFCSNCGTRVSEAPQAAAEEEKTVLLTEEMYESTENADVEAEEELAVPHETAEEELSAESVQEAETEQTEEQAKEQTEEQVKEQIEEQAKEQIEESTKESTEVPQGLVVERVEDVEVLPAGVVETTGTALVQAGHIEQKKFCPNCGSENGINDLFCHACGMSFVNPDQAFQGTEQKQPKKNMSKKNMLKIIVPIAAVVAVAVIALGIVVVPRVLGFLGINVNLGIPGNRGNQTDFILYIKDNELNYAKSSKFEPLLIDDKCYEDKDDSRYSYNYNVTCTPDNKYVYYPHNIDSDYGTYDLYRKKLGDKKAEAEKIDSNVVTYRLIDNDRVAYVKDRNDLRLYIYSKGEASKVASDVVAWDIHVSEDGKYVEWRSNDGDGNLYVQDTALKADKVKLDSDVNWVYAVSDDLNLIVYEKDDNLYILKDMEEKKKIASDIEEVYVYGINNDLQIYYMKEGDEIELSLYDLVEDDYLTADRNMVEPRIEDYQAVIGYDFFGNPRTKTIYSYYDAYEEYELKLMRDDIRSRLQNEDMDGTTVEIYHYDSGNDESNKVFDGYAGDGGNLGTDTALMYLWTVDLEELDKPKLSKLIEEFDPEDYLYRAYYWEEMRDIEGMLKGNFLECALLQYIKDGEVFEVSDIGIDKEALYEVGAMYVFASEKMHTMYLVYDHNRGYNVASSSSGGSAAAADDSSWDSSASDSISQTNSDEEYVELYSFDYNSSDPDTQLISDEVSSIEQVCDEGIYYINEDDELYCNDTKIDSDVASQTIRWKDGMVLYLTDINKNYNEGTLKLYQSGKAVKLADDATISRYQVFDKNQVVFMSDYNFNKYRGDLSVYDGKEVIKVDTDVQTFFICD